ncbi:MAG: hypothetical protein HKN36_05800 [Hellea sp.]|nr:hypothetical protein [Hellea sp.]
MRAALALLIAIFTPIWAAAQSVVDSPEADFTELTIYPDNLAMVTEKRKLTLPAGKTTIRFLGVSDQIIPQTAILQSFEGISLESNFDSSLMTKGALLEKAVGQEIGIARVNTATGARSIEKVKLVSASNLDDVIQGAVVETAAGIEALECAGLWESVVFSKLPDGLSAVPILSVDVMSDVAGDAEITISYLSQGIGWQADYRLDFQGNAGEGALSGWLTITNSTAKSFKDAPTAIVAGELNRDYNTRPERTRQKYYYPTCWTKGTSKAGTSSDVVLYSYVDMAIYDNYLGQDEVVVTGSRAQKMGYASMAAAPMMEMDAVEAKLEEFGDYKLYRAPFPVTVAAQQTKQIAFLNVPDVEFEKIYKFDYYPWHYRGIANPQPFPMQVEYELDNSREGNLAKPLPKGMVRVMTRRENGQVAYLGEDFVENLAIDLPVEIKVSQSSAVLAMPSIETIEEDGKISIRMSAEVSNATLDNIKAEIKINVDDVRYSDIEDESHGRKPNKIVPTYVMDVKSESLENFSVTLPLTQHAVFIHHYWRYGEDDGSKSYKVPIAGKSFALADNFSSPWWIRQLVNSRTLEEISMTAQIESFETVPTDDGEELSMLREKFTFKNDGRYPMVVQFDFPDNIDLEWVNSSISPINKEELEWVLNIPAGESLELFVTTKGAHGL